MRPLTAYRRALSQFATQKVMGRLRSNGEAWPNRVVVFARWVTRLLPAIACLVVLVVVAVPIAMVVMTSFSDAPIGYSDLTLSNFKWVFADSRALSLLGTTVVFAVGASVVAVGLASLFAWAIAFIDLPFSSVLRVLPLAVILLPALLRDTAWIELYSQKIGLVNLVIEHFIGKGTAVFSIYTLLGMIVAQGFSVVPIPYVILLAPFEALDRSFSEASLMSGANFSRTMRRVTIPILAPAFLSAFALTVVLVASSFETPILIGLPGGVQTYMSAIYQSLAGSVSPNIYHASAQSSIYLVLTGSMLVWYLSATRKERRFVSVTGRLRASKTRYPRLVVLVVLAGFLVYFAIAFLLPVLMTLLVSLVPFYTVVNGNPIADLSLANYERLLSTPLATDSLRTSVQIGVLTAVSTVLVATGLSLVSLKSNWRGRRFAGVLATLPIGVPAMVFSVALLLTFAAIPIVSTLYGTFVPMIVAEIVVFLPFGVRIVSSSLIQVEDALLEASAVSGASATMTLRRVLLPILRPSLINAAVVIFVLSFRELGAVVLLVTANTVLVPTVAYNYWENADLGGVAGFNILMLVVSGVVGVMALALLSGRRKGRSSPLLEVLPE